MTPKLRHSTAALLLCVLCASTAQAQTGAETPDPLGLPTFLRRFDRNRDRMLTPEELGQPKMFADMDADGDGIVNGTEAFAYWTNRRAINAPKVAETTAEKRQAEGTFERLAEGPASETTGSPWPQFLGPDRDGIARNGPALARSWPEGGPPVLWRVAVSGGFGGATVDEGRVFLLDRPATDVEALRCFDFASGAELWRHTYPTRNVRLPYSGSRTVPSVEGGLVWTLGSLGELRCFDWRKGELRWRVDLVERAELEMPPRWGFGQSPLRHAGLVIAPAINDERGFLFAFDEKTGELKWQTGDLGGATYVTPTLHRIEGVEQVLMFGRIASEEGVWHGIDPATGEILWAWKGYTNPAQITHPVALGEGRFWITGGYDVGSRIVRISRDGGKGWRVVDLGGHEKAGSQVHTPLLHDGLLFANLNTNENLMRSRRPEGGLGCFDLQGRLLWHTGESPHFDRGGLLLADGLLLALDGETGELAAIDPKAEGYRELGRTKLFKDRAKQSWAPLAIADGRLLARSQTELVCADLRAQAVQTTTGVPSSSQQP
jgi:outer membrane protein assembly factor BamB